MELNKSIEYILDDEKKLKEVYEDSFWRLVMHKCVNAKGEKLLQEVEETKNDPRYAPSPEMTKRIYKTLDRNFRKRKLQLLAKKYLQILNRVAVIFFVFAAILAITYTSVEAFRVQVLNFILTFEKDYVTLKFEQGESNGNIIAGFNNTYAPTYIPKGYRIYNILEANNFRIIEYVNDEGDFIEFYEHGSSGITNVDTENAEIITNIKINETDGLFILKNNIATVSWSYDNKIFIIISKLNEQIDKEEIVKIAESISFII